MVFTAKLLKFIVGTSVTGVTGSTWMPSRTSSHSGGPNQRAVSRLLAQSTPIIRLRATNSASYSSLPSGTRLHGVRLEGHQRDAELGQRRVVEGGAQQRRRIVRVDGLAGALLVAALGEVLEPRVHEPVVIVVHSKAKVGTTVGSTVAAPHWRSHCASELLKVPAILPVKSGLATSSAMSASRAARAAALPKKYVDEFTMTPGRSYKAYKAIWSGRGDGMIKYVIGTPSFVKSNQYMLLCGERFVKAPCKVLREAFILAYIKDPKALASLEDFESEEDVEMVLWLRTETVHIVVDYANLMEDEAVAYLKHTSGKTEEVTLGTPKSITNNRWPSLGTNWKAEEYIKFVLLQTTVVALETETRWRLWRREAASRYQLRFPPVKRTAQEMLAAIDQSKNTKDLTKFLIDPMRRLCLNLFKIFCDYLLSLTTMKDGIDSALEKVTFAAPKSITNNRWPSLGTNWKAEEYIKFVLLHTTVVALDTETRDIGCIIMDIAHLCFVNSKVYGWSNADRTTVQRLLVAARIKNPGFGATTGALQHMIGVELVNDISRHGSHLRYWSWEFERRSYWEGSFGIQSYSWRFKRSKFLERSFTSSEQQRAVGSSNEQQGAVGSSREQQQAAASSREELGSALQMAPARHEMTMSMELAVDKVLSLRC
ncbi:hypothetical protein SELMODRAFT_412934 [Selaginella moellendorffii]|uniref:Uncharacterized protein n=1 Tax=Selaginella moellendorffii TaxID=88036 RepID=D8RMT4_SELML|nr:hypothetical protein SELMODRAFT_412934 [Selaginella moellendorffii]